MKTFKFYLDASNYFISNSNYGKLDKKEKEYYYFASVLHSWISLESYINAISESLSKGTRIKEHQKAFLQESELRVNDDGIFHDVKIRPSTTKKILFILQHFSKIDVISFRQKSLWRNLKSFEDLRNKIIHHKEIEDITIDLKKAKEYRDLVKETIEYLNRLLFRTR